MNIKVMVIDDSFVDLSLLRRAFDTIAPNVSVSYCDDGNDALKTIMEPDKDRRRPDICLVDIKMPMISGLDVLKRIKSNEATHNISVYMLSSSDSPEDIHKSFEYGCNGYFQKPRRRQDLELMVQSLLNLWTGPARFIKR